MGSITAALREAEVLSLGQGSLHTLECWWLKPVKDGVSLDILCSSSVAATRVEQGLIEAAHEYRRHPELIRQYFQHACACVSADVPHRTLTLPIWLDWIDRT